MFYLLQDEEVQLPYPANSGGSAGEEGQWGRAPGQHGACHRTYCLAICPDVCDFVYLFCLSVNIVVFDIIF